MILKITRQKQRTSNDEKEGSTELITEIYSGENYKQIGGDAIIGENHGIILTSYDQLCEITNEMVHYETLNAYLMNNEGKTIERII